MRVFACACAFLLLAAEPTLRPVSPSTILWAAPSILLSSMLIAWGAESAQFFIAQGFALAILAWLQTLPEFAVEAVLAWHQQVPFLFANLTGALRLLTGLGWPAIYFAAAFVHRRRGNSPLRRIRLEAEHSITVVALLPPLLYVAVIVWKRSLSLIDGAVLTAMYAAYLIVLSKMPPQAQEDVEELELIPRTIVLASRRNRVFAISGLFLAGGLLIYFTAAPFLSSLFALSLSLGLPAFIFIQWVAPFVSEFPEMASTFYFARTVVGAPMALMNMVSSNINQWTLLMAMLPVVLSISRGAPSEIPIDNEQLVEVLMTLGQALLGMLFLINMELAWWEAAALFVLWFTQFLLSAGRVGHQAHWTITGIYFAWAAVEILRMLAKRRNPAAFVEFASAWRQHVRPNGRQ